MHSSKFVFAAQIEGTDHGVQHAVAFCNNWIFDSTLVHALPYNNKSLDWCCQNEDDTCDVKFMKITNKYYLFVPQQDRPFTRVKNNITK